MDGGTPAVAPKEGVTQDVLPASPPVPAADATPPAPAPEPAAALGARDLDVEDQELEALRRAAAAEPAAPAAPVDAAPPPEPAAPAAPAGPALAPEPAAASAPKTVTLTQDQFDALQRGTQEAAYWRGMAEGRAPAAAAPGTPAAPAKTSAQRLDEIDASRLAIAKKFDDGEISYAQATEQQITLDRQARALLQAATPASAAPAAPAHVDDLYLDRVTAELEDAHPYALLIDPKHWAWKGIEQEARQTLLAQGVVLKDGDPRSALAVRTRMAELTDRYGPGMTGIAPAKAASEAATRSGRQAPPAQPAAGATAPTGLPTADERAAKLRLQAQHPPDITGTRGGNNSLADVSDAQIAQMTDDEISALPESIKRKVLPLTA